MSCAHAFLPSTYGHGESITHNVQSILLLIWDMIPSCLGGFTRRGSSITRTLCRLHSANFRFWNWRWPMLAAGSRFQGCAPILVGNISKWKSIRDTRTHSALPCYGQPGKLLGRLLGSPGKLP